ncbi:MAG: SDR family oxidoreductase [Campylobacterales bacterium]|nr:SDR family oxidoreductase [Campylobacterales bacterium]
MSKVILVTGSSKGLGLAIAKELAKNGFSVILNGRDGASLQNAFTQLPSQEKHSLFCHDLTKEDAIEALDAFLKAHAISLYGVVHNLGGKVKDDVQPLHVKTLQASMRLNVEVGIEINNRMIPRMIAQGGGKIVHIGSSAAFNGNASPAYAISKGALHTYVKNSARYYAKENIMMCAVVPSILEHEGSEWSAKRMNEPQKYETRKAQMPLGRFAMPEEIAPYVSALFSIESMQATGSIIALEGGV